MNSETIHNLFSNFQSTVYNAVKAFLQKNKGLHADKQITTSLRIPSEIKEFYECLSEAEATSFNAAIINTLSKVKDQTITEYQKSYSKINDTFDYQINSFFKIIDEYKIDYNDLCALLEYITNNKISRADITNKEKLVDIIDKKAQLKLCDIFDYSYDWLQDNNKRIYHRWPGFQDRWYKNIHSFVQNLILNVYLDETVESFELSFLCCDRNVVQNILSEITPTEEEYITPIAVINRCINGIKIRTYHRFESNNINYPKCRKYFVVLIKMILMLKRHHVIGFPNGYVITPQQHDMIRDGSMHLAELFNGRPLSNAFCLDDLAIKEIYSLLPDESKKTTSPVIAHALAVYVLDNILCWSDTNSSSIMFSDDLASKCNMTKKALTKYLWLFDKINTTASSSNIFIPSENPETVLINLVKIRELRNEWDNCKMLDTSFG
jgi:hypothetical protein